MIGSKQTSATRISRVTKIDRDVLTFKRSLNEVSVACRMSWAASRKTSREEDEAYCLMGTFGVNIPTIYGEGRRAFLRLQEEIVKRSYDASLFAWGGPDGLDSNTFPPTIPLNEVWLNFYGPTQHGRFMLASSPSYFSGNIVHFLPDLRDPLQTFLPGQCSTVSMLLLHCT